MYYIATYFLCLIKLDFSGRGSTCVMSPPPLFLVETCGTRNEMKYFAVSQIPTGYLLFPDCEFHNFGSIINSYQWLLCCIMHCSGLSFDFKKLKEKKKHFNLSQNPAH